MDLEQLTTINIKTDKVKDIADHCNKLLSQNKKVEEAELALQEAKAEQTRLSEEVIPALMSEAGVSRLDLEDGSSVKVSPYYYAKIPEERKADAFEWLRKNNAGDLVKNNLTLSFGKGEDSEAAKIKAELESKGLVVDQKEDVHWQTLRGFVRDQIEKGVNIPSDLFGLYISQKTKITTNN